MRNWQIFNFVITFKIKNLFEWIFSFKTLIFELNFDIYKWEKNNSFCRLFNFCFQASHQSLAKEFITLNPPLSGRRLRKDKWCFFLLELDEKNRTIPLWVIGYCMAIEDRFNICLDDYEQSVAYFDICFKECYKKHLDRQCDVVQMGMKLTEGVFLGIDRYHYQNENMRQNFKF